jgi:hypothetical protein
LENDFVQKEPLDKTFAELWKSIDAEIAAKSTKFIDILSSIKENQPFITIP